MYEAADRRGVLSLEFHEIVIKPDNYVVIDMSFQMIAGSHLKVGIGLDRDVVIDGKGDRIVRIDDLSAGKLLCLSYLRFRSCARGFLRNWCRLWLRQTGLRSAS
jgi:hypothetical protein